MSLVAATSGLTALCWAALPERITGGFLASRNERNERLIAIALGFQRVNGATGGTGQIGAALVFPRMVLLGLVWAHRVPTAICWSAARLPASSVRPLSAASTASSTRASMLGLAMSPLVFGPLLDAGQFQAALLRRCYEVAALLTAVRIGTAARAARLLHEVAKGEAKRGEHEDRTAIRSAKGASRAFEKSAPDSFSKSPRSRRR